MSNRREEFGPEPELPPRDDAFDTAVAVADGEAMGRLLDRQTEIEATTDGSSLRSAVNGSGSTTIAPKQRATSLRPTAGSLSGSEPHLRTPIGASCPSGRRMWKAHSG